MAAQVNRTTSFLDAHPDTIVWVLDGIVHADETCAELERRVLDDGGPTARPVKWGSHTAFECFECVVVDTVVVVAASEEERRDWRGESAIAVRPAVTVQVPPGAPSPKQLAYLDGLVEQARQLGVDDTLWEQPPSAATKRQVSALIEQLQQAISQARQSIPAASASEVDDWLADLGRKVEAGDLDGSRIRFAEGWLGAYQGHFEFLVDVQRRLRVRGHLTPGEAKGVLNCYRAQRAFDDRSSSDPTTGPGPEGEGFYWFEGSVWRVQSNRAGTGRYAKRMTPPTDGSKGRFEYVGRWPAGLTEEHRITPELASELGHAFGVCMVCGRLLSNEQSVELGIGPVCRGRL